MCYFSDASIFRIAFTNRVTSCFIWGFLEYMCSSLQKSWALMFPLQNNFCNIYFLQRILECLEIWTTIKNISHWRCFQLHLHVLPSNFIIQICITTKWNCSTVKYCSTSARKESEREGMWHLRKILSGNNQSNKQSDMK